MVDIRMYSIGERSRRLIEGGGEHRETTDIAIRIEISGIDGGRFHLMAGRGWDIEPWFPTTGQSKLGYARPIPTSLPNPPHILLAVVVSVLTRVGFEGAERRGCDVRGPYCDLFLRTREELLVGGGCIHLVYGSCWRVLTILLSQRPI
jgi:hypothetical protein